MTTQAGHAVVLAVLYRQMRLLDVVVVVSKKKLDIQGVTRDTYKQVEGRVYPCIDEGKERGS